MSFEQSIVVFVEGGCVQGVEGPPGTHVIVCDFDTDGETGSEISGRPVCLNFWNEPESPSEEYKEIMRLLEREPQPI